MKKTFVNLCAVFMLVNAASAQKTNPKNQQWQQLFNGKDTQGWHTYLKPKAESAWSVVNGTLQLDPKAAGQGDLVTDKEYENFDLSLEWNIAAGGNSGIIFSVHEDPELQATYDSGIEMQVLDNKDAEDNKKATHLAGSLYDLKAPSVSVAKPAGEWNLVRLKKLNGQLTFWLNGTQVVETKIGGAEWETLLNNSKFKTWKNFAKYPKGHIALQDHGAQVSFKNIKIREL